MGRPKKQYKSGDKVGIWELEFIEEVEPHISTGGTKHRAFKVKCPVCGKLFETTQNQLNRKARPVKQCQECSQKENNKRIADIGRQSIVDLKGKKFGKLTVLSMTDKRANESVVWHCVCSCEAHNEIDVSSTDLQRGHTKSCGCLTSKGEEKIGNLLAKMSIAFEKEKVYDDLVNPKTNQPLRFDFYLPQYNCLIEYDGVQHFTYNNSGWNNKEHYEGTIYRDGLKNQYCIDHNIKLIRIPYTDFDFINEIYLKSKLDF